MSSLISGASSMRRTSYKRTDIAHSYSERDRLSQRASRAPCERRNAAHRDDGTEAAVRTFARLRACHQKAASGVGAELRLGEGRWQREAVRHPAHDVGDGFAFVALCLLFDLEARAPRSVEAVSHPYALPRWPSPRHSPSLRLSYVTASCRGGRQRE